MFLYKNSIYFILSFCSNIKRRSTLQTKPTEIIKRSSKAKFNLFNRRRGRPKVKLNDHIDGGFAMLNLSN